MIQSLGHRFLLRHRRGLWGRWRGAPLANRLRLLLRYLCNSCRELLVIAQAVERSCEYGNLGCLWAQGSGQVRVVWF